MMITDLVIRYFVIKGQISCSDPMVKHGNTLMPFTVIKPKRLIMYVLCWPQMGSIPME
jgi:hypothetical protein